MPGRVLAATIVLLLGNIPAPSVRGGDHGGSTRSIFADTARCFPDTIGLSYADTTILGLAPGPLGSEVSIPSADDLMIAQAIRENFQGPNHISLPLWARFSLVEMQHAQRDEKEHAERMDHVVGPLGSGLASNLSFDLRPDGRLDHPEISIETASPELNASIVAAVRRADSLDAFPFAGPDAAQKRRQIVLHLVDYTERIGPAVPLARVVLPKIHLETPVQVLTRVPPRYPLEEQQRGIAGFVELQWVVTVEGRADPNTFRILRSQYRHFAASAIAAVMAAKFRPATVRGCPVPMLVQQKISFNIGHLDH